MLPSKIIKKIIDDHKDFNVEKTIEIKKYLDESEENRYLSIILSAIVAHMMALTQYIDDKYLEDLNKGVKK